MIRSRIPKVVFVGLCFVMVLVQYKLYLKASHEPFGNNYPEHIIVLDSQWGDYLAKYGIGQQYGMGIGRGVPGGTAGGSGGIYPVFMWGVDGFSMQMFYLVLSRWSMWNGPILNWTLHTMWLLATFFWFLYFLEVTANVTLSAFGWAVLAWLPSWSGSFYAFQTETLLLPALGLALFLIWRAVRVKNMDAMILAVLAGSFAMHSKQTAAPDILLALGWMFWKIKDWRKIVPSGLILLFVGIFIPLVYFHFMIGTWNPLGELRFNQISGIMGPRYVGWFPQYNYKNVQIYLSRHPGGTYMGPMAGGDDDQHPIAPLGSYTCFYSELQRDMHIDLARSWTWRVLKENIEWHNALNAWSRNVIMGLFDDFNVVGKTWWEKKTHRAIAFIWTPLLCVIVFYNLRVMRQTKQYYFTPCLCMILWFMFLLFPTGFTHGRYRKPFEGQLIGNGLWLVEYARRRRAVQSLPISHPDIIDDLRIAA